MYSIKLFTIMIISLYPISFLTKVLSLLRRVDVENDAWKTIRGHLLPGKMRFENTSTPHTFSNFSDRGF